ncbi:hypothetical protein D3C81_1938670 [compost metagenome]
MPLCLCHHYGLEPYPFPCGFQLLRPLPAHDFRKSFQLVHIIVHRLEFAKGAAVIRKVMPYFDFIEPFDRTEKIRDCQHGIIKIQGMRGPKRQLKGSEAFGFQPIFIS